MNNLVMFIIVIGTTIWVGQDSHKHKIAINNKPYSRFSNGSVMWTVGCLLLWIVIFPLYLVYRYKALSGTSVMPPPLPQADSSSKATEGGELGCKASPTGFKRETALAEVPSHKACPMCGESILSVAKKCKHCGSMLTETGISQ